MLRNRYFDDPHLTQIRTVAETGSTNDDLKALASAGAPDGLWLRAERQTAGRGRSGRTWASPLGNLHASTLIRLRPHDPPAPTLALVSALALFHAVRPVFATAGGLMLKWPNDLLVGPKKLAGILLERVDDAVIAGFGVDLVHSPPDLDRPATSLLAETGVNIAADAFVIDLAASLATWLDRWREHGAEVVRDAWLAAAHPLGTPLHTHDVNAVALCGTFDGIAREGACRLRLADGSVRLIHAGDLHLG